MNHQIKHCQNGNTLWQGEAASFKEAVVTALRSGANLRDANLSYADLRGADLSGADLRRVIFSYVDLRGANLRDANLRGASFRRADLRGVKGLPPVPVIPDLDKQILAAVSNGQPRLGRGEGQRLEMSTWHTCETTHCRAGWAITLAGEAGKELEAKLGSSVAGALLYSAAYPELPVPDFHVDNEEALADIRKRAGVDAGCN